MRQVGSDRTTNKPNFGTIPTHPRYEPMHFQAHKDMEGELRPASRLLTAACPVRLTSFEGTVKLLGKFDEEMWSTGNESEERPFLMLPMQPSGG